MRRLHVGEDAECIPGDIFQCSGRLDHYHAVVPLISHAIWDKQTTLFGKLNIWLHGGAFHFRGQADFYSGEATAKLNLVRARANLGPSTGTIANIWKERRVELALEQDRFFDLVRTGQAATVLAGKGFQSPKHNVFPIPQAQRDLSGGRLTQNTGY